jgi:hypothetical protein
MRAQKALRNFVRGEEFRMPDGRAGTVIQHPGPIRVSAILEASPLGKVVSLSSKLVVHALGTFSPNYQPPYKRRKS